MAMLAVDDDNAAEDEAFGRPRLDLFRSIAFSIVFDVKYGENWISWAFETILLHLQWKKVSWLSLSYYLSR